MKKLLEGDNSVTFDRSELDALREGKLGELYEDVPKALKVKPVNIFKADFFVTLKI